MRSKSFRIAYPFYSLALLLLLAGLLITVVFREKPERPVNRDQQKSATAHNPTAPSPGSPTASGPSQPATPVDEVFAEFTNWQHNWVQAKNSGTSETELAKLLGQGTKLAEDRSAKMLPLMQDDPQRALANALSLAEWAALPAEIQALVEEPFSETGRISVFPDCSGTGISPQGSLEIVLRDNQIPHKATTFGQRASVDSKISTLLQGIRLQKFAVVRPSIFQPLTGTDLVVAQEMYAPANPQPDTCFSTGDPLGDNAVTALAGGRLFQFRDEATLAQFEEDTMTLEQTRSPKVSSAMILEASTSDSGFDMALTLEYAMAAELSWTTGPIDVLYIRVDFTDTPLSDKLPNTDALANQANGEVSAKISEISYGLATVSAEVTPIYSLGSSSPYGILNPDARTDLYDNAVATAVADLGSTYVDSFDIRVVVFPYLNMGAPSPWSGLATLGGDRQWLQGQSLANSFAGFERIAMVHETGHNFGANHSSRWVPVVNLNNPVDPLGTWEEYGDLIDIMGQGNWDIGIFNVIHKQRLNWISGSQIQTVSTEPPGALRLYRHDSPSATLLQALEVPKIPGQSYWLDYRYQVGPPDETARWLEIKFKQPDPGGTTRDHRSYLIDPQEGYAGTTGLPVGYTYTDTSATVPVHITPVGQGGAEPNQYLDVQVNFGLGGGVTLPSTTIDGPAAIPARTPVAYSLTGASGTGSSVAFGWNRADSHTSAFTPTRTVTYPWGGFQTLEVTMSNMRGSTNAVSRGITVNDPLLNWNNRASLLEDLKGIATDGNIVVVGGDSQYPGGTYYDNMVFYWSNDGVTWTAGNIENTTVEVNIYVKNIYYGGGLFVGVGIEVFSAAGGGVETRPRIFTSTDGKTWTTRYAPTTTGYLNSVGYHPSVGFVAVGDDGLVLRSTSGTTWSPVTLPAGAETQDYEGVGASATHLFISGYAGQGNRGKLLRTTNGTSWTDQTEQSGLSTSDVYRLIYPIGDDLIFTGFNAEIYHAAGDGTEFSKAQLDDTSFLSSPNLDLTRFTGIAEGNDIYFALGVESNNVKQFFALSYGGEYWYVYQLTDIFPRNGVVFFQNTFLVAGDNGILQQSDPFFRPGDGWDAWLMQFPGYLNETGSVLPDGNSDGDSGYNLVEYALGSNPLTPGDMLHPELSEEGGYLCLTVNRLRERPDVTYSVEISYDLSSWVPVTTTPLVDTDTQLKVRAPQLITNPAYPDQYLRLKVELQ